MLFKPEWVEAVLRGKKRQTVRLKQPRVKVGGSYAVQTSFRSPAVGRIRVTGVRQVRLQDLSATDVKAEGFRTRREFERYFAKVNHFHPEAMGPREWEALRERTVWRIDFEPDEERER